MASTDREKRHWLNAKRLRFYSVAFLFLFVALFVIFLLKFENMVDPLQRPIGGDFITFWAAAKLALQGEPAAAYEVQRVFEAGKAAVPASKGLFAWHYPPTFQLLLLPFALFPFAISLVVWIVVTLAAYLRVVWGMAAVRQAVLLALAFPAAYMNLIHGQTGFLIAALFGGAILQIERRPVYAGLLIGLLSFKPHLGILIPLALLAGRRWRVFVAATATTLGFALASLIVLGPETWLAFWNNRSVVSQVLESGMIPWGKMPTVFVALRLLGAGEYLAYLLHGMIALGVAVAVVIVWWRGAPPRLAGAVLAAGALIVPPYAFDYDLVLLAVPIALLAWEGYEKGWLRGEREILALAWLTPFVGPPIATYLSIQLAPICFLALFAVAVRRALYERPRPTVEVAES